MDFFELERNKIIDFIQSLNSNNNNYTSTDAKKINFSGVLYNVKGSTKDPRDVTDHEKESWKKLLVDYNINRPCYVTDNLPTPTDGPSHPNDWLGGHMTTQQNGTVLHNTCYLMPLCKWHNNKARDEKPFNHTQTEMLELTGYMQGELATTFCLRLPSSAPFAALYFSNDGWKYKNFQSREQANSFISHFNKGLEVEHFFLQRHIESQKLTVY